MFTYILCCSISIYQRSYSETMFLQCWRKNGYVIGSVNIVPAISNVAGLIIRYTYQKGTFVLSGQNAIA